MREVDLKSYDLNLLVALDVLLQEQHVSKSAQRLNISQPAMSRTLARLRIMFDDQLLVRTQGGYTKTPRAQKLGNQVSDTLKSVAQTIVTPQFNPETDRAVFRLCTLDYGEVVLVPKLLNLLEKHAPNVIVETVQRSNYSAQEILQGKADVTIGINLTQPAKNYRVKQLFEDRYVCVMAKSHPLAREKLTLASYLECGHSVTNTGSSTLRQVDQTLDGLNARRNIIKRSPHFLASIFPIQQTRLLHTAPLRLVAPLLKPFGLIAKELPFTLDSIRYCQIWHVRNDDDPAHQWFRRQISEAALTINSARLPIL